MERIELLHWDCFIFGHFRKRIGHNSPLCSEEVGGAVWSVRTSGRMVSRLWARCAYSGDFTTTAVAGMKLHT